MDVEAATYWLGWLRTAQLIAVFLVAVGVAAEFAGEWISRPLERIIDNARELQISQLEKDAETARAAIAAADARAAEANAKALEAQLALEKIKQPRSLEKQLATFTERLKPFSGTRFDAAVIPGDPEAIVFLSHIAAALEMAGWQWVNWNPPDGTLMMVYNFPGKPNVGQMGFFGVNLQVDPAKASSLKPAAEALGTALVSEGFEASLDVVESASIPNKDTVHVIVGRKRL